MARRAKKADPETMSTGATPSGTTPGDAPPSAEPSGTVEVAGAETGDALERPSQAPRPDGLRMPNPYGFKRDYLAGVRLLEDRQFYQLQLQFDEKPSDAVREVVRDAGYRWRPEPQVWTRQIDRDAGWKTRADAERLFDRVTAMIRAEKGIAREMA